MPGNDASALEALLELSRSAEEDSAETVLATVAATVQSIASFKSVALNVYRPAWDDYEAVLVLGEAPQVLALRGTTSPRSTFDSLLDAPQELPGVFFIAADSGMWPMVEHSYDPVLPASDAPDAWLAEDGLLVFLNASDGAPLGFISVDEPVSGVRPDAQDLRLLRAICAHAEQVLDNARRTERSENDQRMLSLLLEVSPVLSACATVDELLQMAGETVVPGLGFERFAAYAMDGPALTLRAVAGWSEVSRLAPELSLQRLERLLCGGREHAGCVLVAADELFGGLGGGGERSARNGDGAAAWREHCLLAPLRPAGEGLEGVLVIEDPSDRLLPSDGRRRAARLLADQVAVAQENVAHRQQLDYLASHDPLTGVRNRRGLDEAVAGHRTVAVLVCDIDHFKLVNDRHGHAVGDRVLARFGELLREISREQDVPMRLGGEEFCLVLPDTDQDGALAVAERLRRESARQLRSLVPEGVTVSIGVSVSGGGAIDSRVLFADADRCLYEAKNGGRNRTVVAVGVT